MTDAQRLDALRAYELLKDAPGIPTAGRLEYIASYFLDMRPTNVTRKTVAEAVVEALEDAEKRGLRATTIYNMKSNLNQFSVKYGDRLVTEITRTMGKTFLDGIKGSPKTRAAYGRYVHGLFEFCRENNYITETANNPFKALRRRKVTDGKLDEKMPQFFAPEQVEKILHAAEEHAPEMVPALVLGLFAGLRTVEARSISWEQIDFDARLVRVLPSVAKARKVRNVEMADALLAWLVPYRREQGLVAPQGRAWRSMLDAVVNAADVEWVKNGCRHSFATYHCALYEDPTKTSYQLGHNSPELLFRHYRGLADRKQAEAFWRIRPETKSNVIKFSKTA